MPRFLLTERYRYRDPLWGRETLLGVTILAISVLGTGGFVAEAAQNSSVSPVIATPEHRSATGSAVVNPPPASRSEYALDLRIPEDFVSEPPQSSSSANLEPSVESVETTAQAAAAEPGQPSSVP